jgi:hypothetical protein
MLAHSLKSSMHHLTVANRFSSGMIGNGTEGMVYK